MPHSPFCCGIVAGIASQVVCHPIDTVRTRLQWSQRYKAGGAVSLVGDVARREGLRGFYKGLSPPLLAQGLYKAVIFSVHSYMCGALSGIDKIWRDPIAGMAAGSSNALIVTPVEFIRNRLQMNDGRSRGSGPLKITRDIIHRYGYRLLFRGYSTTILRDGPGVALYFTAYANVCEWISPHQSKEDTTSKRLIITPSEKLFAASCAGLAFWVWALPLDTLKTAVQAPGNEHRSFLEVTVMLQRQGGLARFFRGWQAAYIRGIPGAAVTLLTFGYLKDIGF